MSEAANADEFVDVVVDQAGARCEDALATELGFEFGAEEFLELVGLNAECIGLELAVEFDAVGDDLGDGSACQVGFDVEGAAMVEAEHDDGGVVAASGIGALAGVEGEGFDCELAGPLVEPDGFVEVFFGPFALFGGDRRVLFLAFERGLSAFGSHGHEGVKVFEFGPEDLSAGHHLVAVLLEEGSGDDLGVGSFDVGVDHLPLLPERHGLGPVLDGAEDARSPAGGVEEPHGEGVAVQGRGEVENVRFGCSCFEEGAEEPVAGEFAAGGCADLFVVFEVIADDECWSVGTEASSADSLASSEGFDGDAVAEEDRAAAPDGAFSGGVGIGVGDGSVGGEFALDVLEVGVGLAAGIGEDPDVGFTCFEGFSQGIGESGDGRLGGSSWCEDIEFGVAVSGSAIEVAAEPEVHSRRGTTEMVGQIGLRPLEEVSCGGLRGCSSGSAMQGSEEVAQLEEPFAESAGCGFGGFSHEL